MNNLTIFDHPLIAHKLSMLRDEKTGVTQFRDLIEEISMLMGYEALRDIPTQYVEIKTPITTTKQRMITGKLAIVPVLRAGLGMVDGFMALVPSVKIGHIGLYRDKETLEPQQYYCKLPGDIANRNVIVLDPMLATGASASEAVRILKEKGCTDVKFLCIVATPEGIQRLTSDHPDVHIYCCSVDEKLNSDGYIVPGLGDAGDRMFGTK